jgi:hypothetical protein
LRVGINENHADSGLSIVTSTVKQNVTANPLNIGLFGMIRGNVRAESGL